MAFPFFYWSRSGAQQNVSFGLVGPFLNSNAGTEVKANQRLLPSPETKRQGKHPAIQTPRNDPTWCAIDPYQSKMGQGFEAGVHDCWPPPSEARTGRQDLSLSPDRPTVVAVPLGSEHIDPTTGRCFTCRRMR